MRPCQNHGQKWSRYGYHTLLYYICELPVDSVGNPLHLERGLNWRDTVSARPHAPQFLSVPGERGRSTKTEGQRRRDSARSQPQPVVTLRLSALPDEALQKRQKRKQNLKKYPPVLPSISDEFTSALVQSSVSPLAGVLLLVLQSVVACLPMRYEL